MRSPRSPAGASGPGAQISFGNRRSSSRIGPLAPAVQRLRSSVRLQHAFRQLYACGPQPVAMFIAELLDEHGIPPQVLDCVLTWRGTLDPDLVRALAGDFPPPPLDLVPPP